ncbi:MAG: hypothetical protein WBP64_12200 [Nitrososphaeraceae archaeon]
MYKNLHADVMNLNQKKRDAEGAILKLNGDYINLSKAADHQTICEAAVYRNNKITDKKQSTRGLLLLGFARS